MENKWFLKGGRGSGKTIRALYEVYGNRITELEKENAELKKKCYKKAVKDYCEVEKQLAKAKEIIRSLYSIIQGRIDYKNNIPLNDEMYRAEQFLKGEDIILEDAQAGNSPFDADEVFNKEMKAYSEEK